MKSLLISAVMVAAAIAGTPQVSAKSFPPRDECTAVPGAEKFRLTLTTAVANRNADMLLPLFSPEVLLDFGGGSGRELLRERLSDPQYDLWSELDQLMVLGCGAGDGGLYLPHYWGEDLGTEDPFSTFLVVGQNIPLMKAPGYDPELKATGKLLDWEVVTLVSEWDDQAKFAEVETASKRRGYVAWTHLRSQVDYRLLATREAGKWMVTAFVAGD